MERLTYKLDKPMKSTYLYYEYMRIADYDIKRNNYGRITDAMIYNKLGKIEDFLEEHKFESLQHLKDEFEELKAGYDFIYEHGTDAINELKKENEALRRIVDGVDKLKQYDVDVEDYILINHKTSYIDGISLDESMKLKQENKTLKDRWQKLKEYVEQFKEYDSDEANVVWKIADKMMELEGDSNDKKEDQN